mmetsp:Transcript_34859/g.78780  ORF Transcript_34859/g.78780 Transcript_34859/m.78780 type:complete len:150 (-) Transcript_34859:280-729(-)
MRKQKCTTGMLATLWAKTHCDNVTIFGSVHDPCATYHYYDPQPAQLLHSRNAVSSGSAVDEGFTSAACPGGGARHERADELSIDLAPLHSFDREHERYRKWHARGILRVAELPLPSYEEIQKYTRDKEHRGRGDSTATRFGNRNRNGGV